MALDLVGDLVKGMLTYQIRVRCGGGQGSSLPIPASPPPPPALHWSSMCGTRAWSIGVSHVGVFFGLKAW